MKTVTVKLCELVEDFELYPRNDVSSVHVTSLVYAIESGAELPLIIADEKTLRIVDGFHRKRALQRLYGPDHEIEIEVRKYKSEKDLFSEAVNLNAGHGRPFAPAEKAKNAMRLRKLGASEEEISALLRLSVERIKDFVAHRAAINRKTKEEIPIKQTCSHLRGQKLTQKQVEGNERAGGMSQLYFVNQVINLVENDVLDTSNEKLMAALRRLQELLEGVVDHQAA